MINIDHQVSTVDRRVGDRVIDAGQARTTTVSQSYRATVDDVWDACTNPHRLPRWFLPISGDLRLHDTSSSKATPAEPSWSAILPTGSW